MQNLRQRHGKMLEHLATLLQLYSTIIIDGKLALSQEPVSGIETYSETIERYSKELGRLARTVYQIITESHELDELTQLKQALPEIKHPSANPEIRAPFHRGIITERGKPYNYLMLFRNPALNNTSKVSWNRSYPISLVLLLQVWNEPGKTGMEVHGIDEYGNPLEYGGIEVYVPLDLGFEITVDDTTYQPKPGEVVVVKPGEKHSVKYSGDGKGRMLILGGYGFSRGTKISSDMIKT